MKTAVALALNLAVGLAAPAFAQSQLSTVSRENPVKVVAARQSLADFAKCLSVNQQSRVQDLIGLPVDSTKYRRLAIRLYDTVDAMCAGDATLKYNPVLFAGAIYDALYTRDFGYGGPTAFPETIVTNYASRYPAPQSVEARQAIAIEHFGECVARAEPAAARALLMAGVGTAEEGAQFAALKPRFAACVVNGKTVEMSKAVIRGAVAEGMYRLSHAAAGRVS